MSRKSPWLDPTLIKSSSESILAVPVPAVLGVTTDFGNLSPAGCGSDAGSPLLPLDGKEEDSLGSLQSFFVLDPTSAVGSSPIDVETVLVTLSSPTNAASAFLLLRGEVVLKVLADNVGKVGVTSFRREEGTFFSRLFRCWSIYRRMPQQQHSVAALLCEKKWRRKVWIEGRVLY